MKSTLRIALSAFTLIAGASLSHAGLKPIMTGLHSPRGLYLAGDGTLYVAEAGNGGTATVPMGEGSVQFGLSGGVSKYQNGVQSRVIPFLPSYTTTENGDVEAVGPTNVAVSNGRIFVTFGGGGGTADRAALGPVGGLFSTLTVFSQSNPVDFHVALDLAKYETNANPDKGAIDSDPYGLLVKGGVAFVADAAGNDVIGYAGGFPWTVTVLPGVKTTFAGNPFTAEPVPTSVTLGPDGALYVGQLTGFPFPVGEAMVFRIDQYGNRTTYAHGLSSIIDIQFDKSGDLYVLQYSVPLLAGGPSSLIKIDKAGNKTTVISDLQDITSFALGSGGSIYLSNGATHLKDGKVFLWTPG